MISMHMESALALKQTKLLKKTELTPKGFLNESFKSCLDLKDSFKRTTLDTSFVEYKKKLLYSKYLSLSVPFKNSVASGQFT